MVAPINSTQPSTHLFAANYDAIQNPLNKAEILYKNFDQLGQIEKDVMADHLRTAYSELYKTVKNSSTTLPKNLEAATARIFFLYGKCLYGGNMEQTHEMFQISLRIQLLAPQKNLTLEYFKPELKDTLTELTQHKPFANDIDTFLSYPLSFREYSSLAMKNGSKQAFDLAMTFRNLGATYQNIDKYSKPDVNGLYKYKTIFENVYGLADTILEEVGNSGDHNLKVECQWERAQMKYNTGRFLYELFHQRPKGLPELKVHVEGALKTLESLEECLKAENGSKRAKQMIAQIRNIKTIERKACEPSDPEEKKAWLRSQYNELTIAVAIARKNDIDPFLKTMFINNMAAWALKGLQAGATLNNIENAEDLRPWIDETTKYMEVSPPHIYFPSFYQTAINVATYLKDDKLTQKYVHAKAEIEKRLK